MVLKFKIITWILLLLFCILLVWTLMLSFTYSWKNITYSTFCNHLVGYFYLRQPFFFFLFFLSLHFTLSFPPSLSFSFMPSLVLSNIHIYLWIVGFTCNYKKLLWVDGDWLGGLLCQFPHPQAVPKILKVCCLFLVTDVKTLTHVGLTGSLLTLAWI